MADDIDNGRSRARRRVISAALIIATALTVAGCHAPAPPVDPSWNPFAPCPPGMVRVKVVTLPAPQQWACER